MKYDHLETVGMQRDFARMVGISEPAVSGLVERGVIGKGQTPLAILRAYTAH